MPKFGLIIFLSLLQLGCASISFNKGNPTPTTSSHHPGFYAGSKADLGLIALPFVCKNEGCTGALLWPFILPFAVVDLPLSMVADTFYLPKMHRRATSLSLSKKEMWRKMEVDFPKKPEPAASSQPEAQDSAQ